MEDVNEEAEVEVKEIIRQIRQTHHVKIEKEEMVLDEDVSQKTEENAKIRDDIKKIRENSSRKMKDIRRKKGEIEKEIEKNRSRAPEENRPDPTFRYPTTFSSRPQKKVTVQSFCPRMNNGKSSDTGYHASVTTHRTKADPPLDLVHGEV